MRLIIIFNEAEYNDFLNWQTINPNLLSEIEVSYHDGNYTVKLDEKWYAEFKDWKEYKSEIQQQKQENQKLKDALEQAKKEQKESWFKTLVKEFSKEVAKKGGNEFWMRVKKFFEEPEMFEKLWNVIKDWFL